MKFNKNINKNKKYSAEEKNIYCSKEIIRKVYILILKILYNYAILLYEIDIFDEEDKWRYYGAD